MHIDLGIGALATSGCAKKVGIKRRTSAEIAADTQTANPAARGGETKQGQSHAPTTCATKKNNEAAVPGVAHQRSGDIELTQQLASRRVSRSSSAAADAKETDAQDGLGVGMPFLSAEDEAGPQDASLAMTSQRLSDGGGDVGTAQLDIGSQEESFSDILGGGEHDDDDEPTSTAPAAAGAAVGATPAIPARKSQHEYVENGGGGGSPSWGRQRDRDALKKSVDVVVVVADDEGGAAAQTNLPQHGDVVGSDAGGQLADASSKNKDQLNCDDHGEGKQAASVDE